MLNDFFECVDTEVHSGVLGKDIRDIFDCL